jgi:ELWxxDGT repeat protein
LKEFDGRDFGFSYSAMLDVYGTLYFTNEQGTLWRSNGTAATTVALKDFDQINFLGKGGGRAIFSATVDGRHELWRSSGTTNSTAKLKTIHPEVYSVSTRSERVTANDLFYFMAQDEVHGYEVWRSNGTTSGTYMLKDIRQNDPYESEYYKMASFRDSLYFTTKINALDYALFKSDGTTAGTTKVADVPIPETLVPADDYLLIFTDQSEGVWISRGTAESTTFLSAIESNQFFHDVSHVVVDGVTYFTTGATSNLWRTDGTECGTFPLDTPAEPSPVTVNGTDLIFGAYTEPYGKEPYRLSLLAAPSSPCASENSFVSQTVEMKAVEYGPNPFTEKVTLKINGSTKDNVAIAVKSFTGEIIHKAENVSTSTDFALGENWPKGLYIVDVLINGKSESFRLVKK